MKMNWNTIAGPEVVVDSRKAKRNIARMQEKAQTAGVDLRPHFKTHQSPLIGKWFGPPEQTPIAVSSVPMARLFADAGWRDILIAIPLNPRQLPAYNRLAREITLGLTVEHIDALKTVQRLMHPIDLYVEIDAGYGRTGISWRESRRIYELLKAAHELPQVRHVGILLHAGNSYTTRGDHGIAQVHQESLERLQQLLADSPIPTDSIRVSVGDTPTCSRMDSFPGADEIRPGNYVFYDWQQQRIGACDWSDIALAVACPVIARYPERGEVVVHGGAVHFSKDFVLIDGKPRYGQVMRITSDGWGGPIQDAYVHGLSQEHGKVKVPDTLMAELQLGDLLVIVPAHSCLVMDASKGECVLIR
ncbi:alanine racemase [Aliidiomarina halalkaliphila]|uniref:Alanine racemase n=1 Tax=Aliidiomarina halalkaliphila TaxID=2593535 RepID=A0A552X2X6_9GAMM|nr:alanine racemase [Aliidiomarina halalkaliphila]TRW48963.1 alanine racemase [Aliidiomarina halalkaliphila]